MCARNQQCAAGGQFPRWRADGKELFYVALDGTLMAAEVSRKGESIEVGAIHSLGIRAILNRS